MKSNETSRGRPKTPTPAGSEARKAVDEDPAPRSLRGFAAMTKRRLLEVAASGGRAAHLAGKAHTFSSEEARVAGRKGGKASRRRAEPRPGARRSP